MSFLLLSAVMVPQAFLAINDFDSVEGLVRGLLHLPQGDLSALLLLSRLCLMCFNLLPSLILFEAQIVALLASRNSCKFTSLSFFSLYKDKLFVVFVWDTPGPKI